MRAVQGNVVTLKGQQDTICFTDTLGLPYCFGQNVYGQLGISSNNPRVEPLAIEAARFGGNLWSEFDVSYLSVVLTSKNQLYQWVLLN